MERNGICDDGIYMMQYVGGEDVDLFEAANVWWMFSILAVKKIMKLSRCVTVSK